MHRANRRPQPQLSSGAAVSTFARAVLGLNSGPAERRRIGKPRQTGPGGDRVGFMENANGNSTWNGNGAPPRLVDCREELDALLVAVRAAEWVAMDTEADSLHAYPEKLCLLQLSLPGRDELVDPLAGLDLRPLMGALDGRRLILHGADYDLRLLYRTYGFVPVAVFDTMLAARLLGYSALGLDKLVGKFLGVHLEKGHQRANWGRRPLTARMAEYARNDSRHLKPLADRLEAELQARGRAAWHREACDRLLRDASQPRSEDPDAVWRVSGASRLDRRGLAVLREVWRWREREARAASLPPFFILPHEALIGVSQAAVDGSSLAGHLPARWSDARRERLRVAVDRALELPESECPKHKRPSGRRLTVAERVRHLELTRRRDRQAQALQLDPSVLASRAQLLSLALDESDAGNELMAWQRELLLRPETR